MAKKKFKCPKGFKPRSIECLACPERDYCPGSPDAEPTLIIRHPAFRKAGAWLVKDC